jgi:hypothetical protein
MNGIRPFRRTSGRVGGDLRPGAIPTRRCSTHGVAPARPRTDHPPQGSNSGITNATPPPAPWPGAHPARPAQPDARPGPPHHPDRPGEQQPWPADADTRPAPAASMDRRCGANNNEAPSLLPAPATGSRVRGPARLESGRIGPGPDGGRGPAGSGQRACQVSAGRPSMLAVLCLTR